MALTMSSSRQRQVVDSPGMGGQGLERMSRAGLWAIQWVRGTTARNAGHNAAFSMGVTNNFGSLMR